MAELFPYALEALENTHKIAQRCHVEIEFGVTKLPRFDVPDGLTSWEYLNKLCFEGLEERYQPVTEELKARLNYELSTIKNMGYVDYFLIVWDFIKYARDHDIMVGPGRGSAAGSLVAYTLGITQLDPIRYDLLFERFLNHTIIPIFTADIFNNLLPSFEAEVNVNIRHRYSFRIQKSLKEQTVTDRIQLGDSQRIGNQKKR